MNHLRKIFIAASCVSIWSNISAQQIPADPAVRTGKLANGFTYYIRHNQEPQKRVELYLINKVGSNLEDEDQQGLAHFMEHMNFNGTKNYPKNDLVDFLQRAGVRFGADLNAYTSFDETVYQLPIPTDDPAMFGNGLKILRDWAQEAALDPTEIEKERGVVLEEERLGKGARDRMSRQYMPLILNHSRYASRLPIGIDDVLTKFKPEVIRRFHHDWYRPDLQALIIVGDVNLDEAERMVRIRFADLKNPANERPRPTYNVQLGSGKQFITVTDKEEPASGIEILMKHKARGVQTEADYLELMKRGLLNQLLNQRRYSELAALPNTAFRGVSLSISELLGGVDMLDFNVSSKDEHLEQAFRQTFTVFERIKRFGFTANELSRAKEDYLRTVQNSFNERDKTPSVSFVKEYQALFLHKEAAPGIAWEYDFVKKHIGDISIADLTALLKEYTSSPDVDVLVTGPEKFRSVLPDSSKINTWINAVTQQALKPYDDSTPVKSLLAKKPKPGKVIARTVTPKLNLTRLTLSNGLTVILKSTTFKNDQILYYGFAPGGSGLYNGIDFDIASNAAGLESNYGWGELNPVELSKALTGKIASSKVGTTLRSDIVNGSAVPEDLETALQLTWLQFTHPRKDSVLFKNLIDNAKSALANRYVEPNNVFADTVNFVMANYNYRFAPPTVDRMNKIAMDRAYDIYRERFGDASGFTFVFVGNFTEASIVPLIERYLGSLPSTHTNVKVPDLGIHIPAGIITKKVYKGTEDKATVRMVFSGKYDYNALNNIKLKALGDILQIKVLQQLREAESEVYSPQVQVIFNKYPEPRFAIFVSFGCAPKNVDHLINLVEQETGTLAAAGPEADDLEKFKASYKKNIELALKDNSFWLGYLSGQLESKENPLQVLDLEKNLNLIDAATLKAAAEKFLSGENVLTFELLPATQAP